MSAAGKNGNVHRRQPPTNLTPEDGKDAGAAPSRMRVIGCPFRVERRPLQSIPGRNAPFSGPVFRIKAPVGAQPTQAPKANVVCARAMQSISAGPLPLVLGPDRGPN